MNQIKLGRHVEARVFCKEGEDESQLSSALLSLFPFNLEEEKIKFSRTVAEGVNENKIIILTVNLEKDRHINTFIKKLFLRFTNEQRTTLIKQLNSRIDDEVNFFIRFDKDKLRDERILELTDTGNCFHVRIHVAAYPAKKESAIKFVKEALEKYSDKD